MSTAHSRFRTAVHAMTVIAYVPEQQATSDAIAGSINTDPSVVRRLLSMLREAGLVQGAAGRLGGYALARSPKKISLKDVFDAVGTDDLFPFSDRPTNAGCPVGSKIGKALQAPLQIARRKLESSLAKTTIADLVEALDRP